MWAEVVAATNIVAREEAKRRGYLDFRVDKESLDMFKKIVHCRAIEADDTDHIAGTLHGNNGHEISEGDSNHNEKVEMEYSAKYEVQWPNTKKTDPEEKLCITEEGESQQKVYVLPHAAHMYMAHVYRRYNISGQRRNRAHRTKILQCELETQGNFRIVVHPGHPIAKNAAIGGTAGAITGGTAGAVAGYVIGGVVGVIGGPPGMVAGTCLGCLIGVAIGAVSGAGVIGGTGGALGALWGVADRCDIQFTIKAERVFQKLSNFEKVGNRVFCQVTVEERA